MDESLTPMERIYMFNKSDMMIHRHEINMAIVFLLLQRIPKTKRLDYLLQRN